MGFSLTTIIWIYAPTSMAGRHARPCIPLDRSSGIIVCSIISILFQACLQEEFLCAHAVNGEIHEYKLGANQGFLICPSQINLYTADEQQPWKYVWLEFDRVRIQGSTAAKEHMLLKPTQRGIP